MSSFRFTEPAVDYSRARGFTPGMLQNMPSYGGSFGGNFVQNMPAPSMQPNYVTDPGRLPSWYGTGEMVLDPNAGAAAAAKDLQNAQFIGAAGLITSIFGSINSAIGSYYAAESQKNQLKMQAANQRFQAEMARINARGAEYAAQQTMMMGGREISRYGMQAGQRRSSAQAALAARGGQAGVGSAREVMASMDIVSDIDRLTMNAARVRQAEAQRMQAVNYQTQAVTAGVSAENLMGTAGTISSGLASFTSLLGSAGTLAQTWAQNRRFEDMLAAQQMARFS